MMIELQLKHNIDRVTSSQNEDIDAIVHVNVTTSIGRHINPLNSLEEKGQIRAALFEFTGIIATELDRGSHWPPEVQP